MIFKKLLKFIILFHLILGKIFVVHCSVEEDTVRFFVLNLLSLISAPRRIISIHCYKTSTIIEQLKFTTSEYFQIVFIKLPKEISDNVLESNQMAFFLDLDCPGAEKILLKAKKLNSFRTNNVWMLRGNIGRISNSHFFSRYSRIFHYNRNNSTVSVFKIYKITQFSKNFTIIPFFKWDLKSKVLIYENREFGKRLTNLMKEPIRVSYALVRNETFQHLTDYRYPEHDQACKITYILMKQICALFNATHVQILRRHWGIFNKRTKSYGRNTVFSDLQENLADLSGNSAALSNDRLDNFKCLVATGKININIPKWFFKSPQLSSAKIIWVFPFSANVWISVLIISVIFYGFFYLIAIFETHFFEAEIFLNENGFYIATNLIIAALTWRGSCVEFSSFTGKCASYCFFIFTLLLSIAYSANLLVLLQSTLNNVNNFNDLENLGFKFGSDNESYNKFYFTKSNDLVVESIRRKVYSHIRNDENNFWMNATAGFRKVQADEKFAFHIVSTLGYIEMAKLYDEITKRAIRIVHSDIHLPSAYLCVPKSSSIEDFLAYGFQYLHEIGAVQRERNILFQAKPPSLDSKAAIFESLRFKSLFFLFMFLVYGALLSIVILIVELLVFNYRKRSE